MPRPRCRWSLWMTAVAALAGLLLLFQESGADEGLDSSKSNVQQERLALSQGSAVDRSDYQKPKPKENVKLDIYYETNCPDSMDFITKQLWPTFRKMSSIMKVNLIPYGKATERVHRDGTVSFYCHHGPSECFGNSVQACAIKLYPDPEKHISYINCMESYLTPSSAGSKCARRNSLDYSRILDCANGPDGNKYMREMAAATKSLNPPLSFVPWVVVNDVFSDSVQKQALDDLASVVCTFHKGTKPASCLSSVS